MSQQEPSDRALEIIVPDREAYILNGGKPSDYDGILQYLSDLYVQRRNDAQEFRPGLTSYNLPQLPDSEIDEVYERVRQAERQVSPDLSRHGYELGTATVEDDLIVIEGLCKVVLTAEHATQHMRLNKDGVRQPKEADWGTCGLGLVVREDTEQALILPIGLQTGDANDDMYIEGEVPLKDNLRSLVKKESTQAHLSLHGIGPTRAAELDDKRSFSAFIGIGNKPTPQTQELAERMVQIGRDLGLRVGINQSFIPFLQHPRQPERASDGSLKRVKYAGGGPNTTRTFSEDVARAAKKQLASVQLELSNALTLLPEDWSLYPGKESQRRGVWLGTLFTTACVELISRADDNVQ